MKRIVQFSILTVMMMMAMISCEEKGNDTAATGITLSETDPITLRVGATAALTASVEPLSASQKIVWSSSTPGIVTVNGGAVTGILPGMATITVTTIDGDISASIFVTVINPITGISIKSDELIIAQGEKLIPLIALTPPSTFDRNVIWSIDDPSVASIDPYTGEITGLSLGTATITVVSLENEEIRDECIVIVKAIAVTGVKIDWEAPIVLSPGQTEILTATVLPANANNREVTWKSENPEFVTVDSNTGKITAIAVGTAIITVTTVEGNYTDQCTVEVKEKETTGSLLDNPGFEEGVDNLPDVWQKVPQTWFDTYPEYADNRATVAVNLNQTNRIGRAEVIDDNFFSTGNGVFFEPYLTENWCGRMQANVTGGFYQTVTLEPGTEYSLSLDVGYRCNNVNTIIRVEYVKILSPDGMTTYNSIPIPLNPEEPTTGNGTTQVIKVATSFVYNGPATPVRFQIDQRGYSQNPNQAPVMLFDNIELNKK